MIHSSHGPISYCFRDKRRFRSKIAKKFHRVYNAPIEVVPRGTCNGAAWGSENLQNDAHTIPSNKCDDYVHSSRRNAGIGRMDGRTDGQTELVTQYRAVHA